ncbi:MAG: hypothetical protein PHQ19_08800 [Candidatus Krumholzibacteria bacterium]|nr:hypothetical protein [Candidatus Krumholzibacteria bacterium]
MKRAAPLMVLAMSVATAVVLIAADALAQVPQTLSYQGVLTDDAGTAVEDGDYSLTFHIYAAASGGTALRTESKTVAVVKGIFNAILGTTVPLSLPFDRQYWLGIQVQGGAELSPRVELASTPYAMNVAEGRVVKSINTLADSVTLAAGSNVTITPSGNTLSISSTGAGSDGAGRSSKTTCIRPSRAT